MTHDGQDHKHETRSHDHGHSHGHSHQLGYSHGVPAGDYLNRAFIIGIVLNLLFVGVEFVAGLILGSVALISDAGHNLSDVISLALAMFAFRLARRKPSDKYTYGRKKSTILVSLANACILLIAIGIILYESIEKLIDPQPVEGGAIAWVAGVGIVINAFTAWLFMRHSKTDLNVKGAFLHMVADTLVSVGVVISGIIISYTGWYMLDPIISIVIVVVIFVSTWGLLRDSVRLSLDGVPLGIDRDKVAAKISGIDKRIMDVHHIHIWALSTTENALTAHITIGSMEGTEELKCRIKDMLRKENIGHATIEFELPGIHGGEEGRDCSCC